VTRGPPSLITLFVRRIAFFAALAMLAQLAGVFAEYWNDDQNLGRLAIEMETDALAEGVSIRNGQPAYALPPDLRARYGDPKAGYFVRVRTASAKLFSNCDRDCAGYFPPLDLKTLAFWMRQIRPGKPLHVAGGRIVATAPEPVMIEVAILGDRDGVLTGVLAHEVLDHMLLPMSLMLVVVLGATVLSVAQVLRPVRNAARQVGRLDPATAETRLPTAGMPSEIAGFTQAVNAAFDRVAELMRSQRLLTSAISHEVRTPLAVVRLELEKIADPRARKVEEDLDALNHLVEQLTDLARVEGAAAAPMDEIDPAALAERVVSDLAELVYASGRSIGFEALGAKPFKGYGALVENALRNLVENAARHAPKGAAIHVRAGPGAVLSVIDDGARAAKTAPPEAGASRRQGLGLRIVSRIAEIHAARFDWERAPGAGVTATIDFAPTISGDAA
jgi:signal transduction histidine kinase